MRLRFDHGKRVYLLSEEGMEVLRGLAIAMSMEADMAPSVDLPKTLRARAAMLDDILGKLEAGA